MCCGICNHQLYTTLAVIMYEGFSKNNGDVIGDTSKGMNMDLGEAEESTAAEESLVCMNEAGEQMVFNAKLSRDTGELTWCQLYDKETIMHRTVGMSQMTSMMRDTDRNSVYERSIAKMIEHFIREHDRSPVVLDIGTGTGLLSMLSVRHGAEFVIGCEMFDMMAAIAEQVTNANDLGDKILIINAKSSEIEDLPVQPDLLVSELLDSALLGEGCLPAHTDALTRLMNPLTDVVDEDGVAMGDFRNRVIPYSGSVLATLIESAEVKHMHDVASIRLAGSTDQDGSLHLHRTPPSLGVPPCRGGWSMVPVHWAEMQRRGGRELSGAVQVLHSNFTLSPPGGGENFSQQEEWYHTDITATSDGTVHGVLLWWNLFLLSPEVDPSRELLYSTAPGAQNWQDHWQQTVYPLPEDIEVKAGETVRVYAKHDAVHLEVYAVKQSSPAADTDCDAPDHKRQRPSEDVSPAATETDIMVCSSEIPEELCDESRNICMCGWHVLCGAERFQMMCHAGSSRAWQAAVDQLVLKLPSIGTISDGVPRLVMDLSDGSLLGLSCAAKLRAQNPNSNTADIKVVSKESKFFSRMFFNQITAANDLDEQMVFWDGKLLQDLADSLVAEEEDNDADAEGTEMQSGGDAYGPCESTPDLLKGSVVAVLSECYYYQLHALPIWQSLSFYYQVQSLRRRGLLHADCKVLPGRAVVRAIALELPQLKNCHGLAGM